MWCVDPARQGRGIGKGLIELALARMWKLQKTIVRVRPSTTKAEQVLTACGFKPLSSAEKREQQIKNVSLPPLLNERSLVWQCDLIDRGSFKREDLTPPDYHQIWTFAEQDAMLRYTKTFFTISQNKITA